MLELKNVSKFYYNKGMVSSGFSKVNLKFDIGEFVAITGESGSGKSTLLNVISGLDSYEEGEMYINGEETSHYSEKDYETYRKKYIGNIFQSFNLVNSYTVYQNIELVLLISGCKRRDIKKKILNLIKEVDLYKYRNRKVSKLSGGQKQRVAIARALAVDSPIILADEPTGNLDKRSSESVLKLLHELSKDKLVIVVTHNYDQIEEYVTRKITMHDGKVIDDKSIKKYNKVDGKETNFNSIRPFNKILLGIRNAFNIIPKFLLICMVYVFIVFSLFFAYGTFNYIGDDASDGYNSYFTKASEDRIVIKKSDKTNFTEDDYSKILSLSNIKRIEKNDIMIDQYVGLWSENYYFGGYVHSLDEIKKVDIGKMPENDNEVVVSISSDDYNIRENKTDRVLKDLYDLEYVSNNKYNIHIVGIIVDYKKDEQCGIYVNNNTLNKISSSINKNYSIVKYTFNGKETISYDNIIPSTKVKKGTVVINEEQNYQCKKMNCKNYAFNVNVKNIYYNSTLKLKVSKTFNKKTINKLTGYSNYDENAQNIFMNQNDYNSLFDKGYFQSSVFVKDVQTVKDTESDLNKLGLTTLYTYDTLTNEGAVILRILNIVKVCVFAFLLVVLFYISYFIIRIVLKSRNIYYSTLRILGASSKCTKSLLNIELVTISHVSYILFIIFVILVKNGVINNTFISELFNYIEVYHYAILYFVILVMSRCITNRYSRKLFKNSVMNTYREEV